MDKKSSPFSAGRSDDCIFLLGKSGTILFASPSLEIRVGLAAQAVTGTSFWDLLHTADRSAVQQFVQGRCSDNDRYLSARILGQNDRPHRMNMAGMLLTLPQLGELVLLICRPVVEPVLPGEAIADMIAGAAHDFNNILTAIMVNLSIAKMEASPNDLTYSALVEAQQACLEGRDLTKRLSSFVRKGFPLSQSESTAEVVKDTIDFTLHGSEVKSSLELPADLWTVCVDRLELSQIIHGVVRTANEAMPAGGRLTVSARNFPVRARSTLPVPTGDYVKIKFEDNGIGLPGEEVAALLQHETTGNQASDDLDLQSVTSLVRRRGGEVQVKSKLGAGTVVTLYLPAGGRSVMAAPDDCDKTGLPKASGKVLILDDEALIRSSLQKMLATMGYDVSVAEDGDTAVALFREAIVKNAAFDVVLLDLSVAGGKGGKEVFKILRQTDPQVKAIITTGYLDDPVFQEYHRLGFAGALGKPFRMREVSGKIQEVLAKS